MTLMLPAEVRQRVSTRIEALEPLDSYIHPDPRTGLHDNAWRESIDPLMPEWEPAAKKHLCFFVDDRLIIDTEGHRNQPGPFGAQLETAATLRFLFALRPHSRKADWDAAGSAGMHLCRHLIGWDEPEILIAPQRNLLTRTPTGDPGWLLVQLGLRLVYRSSLNP